MEVKKGLFKTSIGRKNLMAVTGLFISFFLIIHLAGNLILLLPESFFPVAFWGNVASGHDMYNAYSHFLVHFWPITLIAWILYAAILVHAIDALMLTLDNKKVQGKKYLVSHNVGVTWYSQNMGWLGIAIAAFLILHMGQFWLQYKILGTEHDLYQLVLATFDELWMVIIYEIGIIALGFHLLHGIESAHRSLGFYHTRAMGFIKRLALVFALVMVVLYAIIPIILYLK